jgi:1,4-alpha-glucan branching enzyme
MPGYLALVLHAHLPFVRHPEHERFLEESWLFEAITESYLPLIQILQGWQRDALPARLTLTLSPTLCSMLADSLLQDRYQRHLDGLIELAEKETHRTRWDRQQQPLAHFYLERFQGLRTLWQTWGHNPLNAFRHFQEHGLLEIVTCAATHALLPLLAQHPPSIRGQIITASTHHPLWFGQQARGIWLPECAYTEGIENVLQEVGLRWFILDTHGLLHATPRPRYGVFAPVYTPNGVAVFGRDQETARQVWSRQEGYPGDPRYRDFYRDVGFDLDLDYVAPYLPSPNHRGFTGLKYHAITGETHKKSHYDRADALQAADAHASHFLRCRLDQFQRLAAIMDRPPLLVAPYDAELFGHWWYEGPEFLDLFVRKTCCDQDRFTLVTPSEYLGMHPTQQVVRPSASSWGEEGYWRAWLNESNEWIYPHLQIAQERMTDLARRFPEADAVARRALNQAARELMLAQSSDWPFILRTNTSPQYARQRVKEHLLRFIALHEQLTTTRIDQGWLGEIESKANLFPAVDYRHWA